MGSPWTALVARLWTGTTIRRDPFLSKRTCGPDRGDHRESADFWSSSQPEPLDLFLPAANLASFWWQLGSKQLKLGVV